MCTKMSTWSNFNSSVEIPSASIKDMIESRGILYVIGGNGSTNSRFVSSYSNGVWRKLYDTGNTPIIFNKIIEIAGVLYVSGKNFDTMLPVVLSNSGGVWTNIAGSAFNAFMGGEIKALCSLSNKLHVVGNYNSNSNIFIMNYSNGSWNNFSGGTSGALVGTFITTLISDNGNLYAAGAVLSPLTPFVAKYSGSSWINISGSVLNNMNGQVNEITIHNGVLYASGTKNIGNPNTQYSFVLRYSAGSWSDISIDTPVNAKIRKISIGDGLLYASGYYSNIKPFVSSYSNGVWSNLSGGYLETLTNGNIEALVYHRGNLYAAGGDESFNTIIMKIVISSYQVVQCFLANAPVLTPTGYIKISELTEGDNIITGDGRSVPIKRVLHTRVTAGYSVNPYIIPKGIYGATKNLYISPNHRVSTDTGMIEARMLGLVQEEMTGDIDYYNLELPSWSQDTMVVAGVMVESLAPIQRVTMTIGEFKKALLKQYSEITPAVLAKIQKVCRFTTDNFVECPVIKK